MTLSQLITKVRHAIINLLLDSREEVVCKYRLRMAETEWSNVSVLARDLNRKLTAHRYHCTVKAIDYKEIESKYE